MPKTEPKKSQRLSLHKQTLCLLSGLEAPRTEGAALAYTQAVCHSYIGC